MTPQERLKTMLDAMVNKNEESARVSFHSYLQDKLRALVKPEVVPPVTKDEE